LIPGGILDLIRRPSNKELFNKIRDGKEAVEQGKIQIVDPAVIAGDAVVLGYQVKNLGNVLFNLLGELRIEHYVGAHPPRKSYVPLINDCELFEFKWTSGRLGCDVYLKYCLKGNIFYLVSLHEDRPKTPR
jgi:hypothetical protein